jgi:hypothetical protein
MTARFVCSRLPSILPGAFVETCSGAARFVCSASVLATSRGQGHGIHRRVTEPLARERSASGCSSRRVSRAASGRSEGRRSTRDLVVRAATAAAVEAVIASAFVRVSRANMARVATAAAVEAVIASAFVRVSRAHVAPAATGRTLGRVARAPGAWRVPHDREVRVLAIPLDPAGRFRGDVLGSGQVRVLGVRARHLTRPGAGHPSSCDRASCSRTLGERLQLSSSFTRSVRQVRGEALDAGPRGSRRDGSGGRGADRVCLPACESRARGLRRDGADAGARGAGAGRLARAA